MGPNRAGIGNPDWALAYASMSAADLDRAELVDHRERRLEGEPEFDAELEVGQPDDAASTASQASPK